MRTIRLEKTDKDIPLPDGNPITLRSAEDANFCFGDIRYVKTGLRFYFPADIRRSFESLIPGVVILGSVQPDVEQCLQLIVLCCALKSCVGRMQPVATVTLYEAKPTPVRFAEFVEGKRMICGGAEKVESRPDIRDSKPGT